MNYFHATESMTTYLPRNIVVEDKRPTLQAFMIYMEGVEPWSDPEEKRDPGDLFGILFQGHFDWIYYYFVFKKKFQLGHFMGLNTV